MTLSKRNSRPINVGGYQLRWAFSAPYDSVTDDHRMNLTIQSESGVGSKIIATGRCPTGDGYLLEPTEIVTPQIVSRVIIDAIASGWTPEIDGNWKVAQLESFFSSDDE